MKNTCAFGLNATSHAPSSELIRNLQQIEIKLQAKPFSQKFKHILGICLWQKKNPISRETNNNAGAQENSIISVNEKSNAIHYVFSFNGCHVFNPGTSSSGSCYILLSCHIIWTMCTSLGRCTQDYVVFQVNNRFFLQGI